MVPLNQQLFLFLLFIYLFLLCMYVCIYACIYFNLRAVKAEATIALEMSEKRSAADSADVHHS